MNTTSIFTYPFCFLLPVGYPYTHSPTFSLTCALVLCNLDSFINSQFAIPFSLRIRLDSPLGALLERESTVRRAL